MVALYWGRSGLLLPRLSMALERLSLSVEMDGHRPRAKKQQNLVPGARIAPWCHWPKPVDSVPNRGGRMRAAFQLYPTEAIGYRRLLYANPPRKRRFSENFWAEH